MYAIYALSTCYINRMLTLGAISEDTSGPTAQLDTHLSGSESINIIACIYNDMNSATLITVRPTKPKDAPLLPAVERSAAQAFLQFPDLAWLANGDVQSAEKHLELIESGASWVAVDSKDVPVGFLNGIPSDEDLYICEISVQSDYQGKGIGRRLMEAARQWAASCGYMSISLTTFQKVPWNEGFYKSLGFRTLNANELTPALYNIINEEIDAGLPVEQRCAMFLHLG